MNLQTLHIDGIQQRVRIGCTAEERGWPQILTFTIDMALCMERAIRSDAVSETVDYMEIIDWLSATASDGEWKLIEKLAADVAQGILCTFALVEEVTVEVRKNVSERASGVRCRFTAKR